MRDPGHPAALPGEEREGRRGLSRRGFLRSLGVGAALGLVGKLGVRSGRGADGTSGVGGRGSSLPQRVLGSTGERVPILGLGTAAMGRNLPDAEAVELLHEALALGVTYVDTAPALGGYGRAQQQIGEALNGRRDEVFLVTKCYEPDGESALRLLESNLRELRTDRVDLVHVHSIGADKMRPELVFGRNGVMRALLRAKERGLTRYVGISGHNRPGRFVTALREFDLDVMMTAVNFVDVHTYDFENRVWPVARARGVGLVAMKVFGGVRGGGALMPRDRHPAAVRYALSLEDCGTAVIGMVSKAELRENVQRVRRFEPLSREERAALAGPGRNLARRWGAHFGPVE